MSTQQATTAPSADGRPAKSASSKWAQGARYVLIAMILVLGCNLAYGFGKWLARSRCIHQPVASEQLDSTELGPAAAVMPLAGPWSFDSVDWNLRSQLMEVQDVDKHFVSLAAAPPPTDESQLPETDTAVLDVITALQVRPTEHAGNRVFRLDRPDLKTQLVARQVDGQTRTVSFVIAYRQAGAKWQLYEFDPASARQKSRSAAGHLLPLPATARRDGGRFDEQGQLQLEFISLDSSGDKLLATWKQSGWEVHANDLAGPGDFSFLCRWGDEVIYAWSADPHDSLRNLMLVRTPNVADTGR